MDRTIMESLEQWTTLARQQNDEARDHLRTVLHYAVELVRKADRSTLDEVRYRLERAIVKEKPADWYSYCLGIAQGMVDWMNASAQAAKSEELTAALPELERQLLRCIAEHPHITPSDIMKRVRMENKQHVSNLLGKLRAKELVHCQQVGKYRWYTVTELGQAALDGLKTKEEHAAARQTTAAATATLNDMIRWNYAMVVAETIGRPTAGKQQQYVSFQYNSDIEDCESDNGWLIHETSKQLDEEYELVGA